MDYDFKTRYNVMNISSISGFLNIRGGINNNCKDVYFVRIIGANDNFINDIEKADKLFTKKTSDGILLYNRIKELPRLTSPKDIEFYSQYYDKWIKNGKNKLIINESRENDFLENILKIAYNKVLNLFKTLSYNVNESIEKNFAVKLLFCYDKIWNNLFSNNWNLKTSVKLILENISKRQDYLFCYFLTLIGIDVLLLQYKKDITDDLKKLNLSNEVIIGAFYDKDIPLYNPKKYIETNISEKKKNINPVIIQRPVKKNTPKNRQVTTKNDTRTEMTFEELALLTSSVVKISILDGRNKIIGTGSGIMIGKKGYILTNSHVANGGMAYSVEIENDEKKYFTDEIIKYDYIVDLAIIRINKILTPLPVYKSGKELVRGQKVVAIGSPFGLSNSISDGIISGFRNIEKVGMIQFTAPISPGSSGGAVLNMFGEVIGISTASIDAGQNINLAVNYEFINNFIKGFV